MVNLLFDNIAVGGLMLQSSWFLPFLLSLCFWVVSLAFLYRVAAQRGVSAWMFWWWMISYGILVAFFGFLFAGVKREGMSAELLWKGAAFSCLFGIVLGLLHFGIKSLPAPLEMFVKALAFCCMMGVVLLFAFEGVMHIGIMRGILLKGLVFALLLKLPVSLLKREGDDSVLQRSLRVLNVVLFGGILGFVLFFVSQGGQKLGLSWLWFSNDHVFTAVGVFTLLSLCQGARCACVMAEVFFKRVGGRSR